MIRLFALLSLLHAPLPAAGAFQLEGRDLLDQDFSFAQRVSGRAAVLIFGFSKASGDQNTAWDKGLGEDLKGNSMVAVVNVALLEKAPAFVRGFIKKGMRKGAPAERHPWMVVLDKGTKAWETALGYDPKVEPDHSRLVVVDPQGRAVEACSSHEAYSPEAKAKVLACLRAALQAPPKGKR